MALGKPIVRSTVKGWAPMSVRSALRRVPSIALHASAASMWAASSRARARVRVRPASLSSVATCWWLPARARDSMVSCASLMKATVMTSPPSTLPLTVRIGGPERPRWVKSRSPVPWWYTFCAPAWTAVTLTSCIEEPLRARYGQSLMMRPTSAGLGETMGCPRRLRTG